MKKYKQKLKARVAKSVLKWKMREAKLETRLARKVKVAPVLKKPVAKPKVAKEVKPAAKPKAEIKAYCVRCKQKVTIANPQPTTTKKGVKATKGNCSICGGNVYRIGG